MSADCPSCEEGFDTDHGMKVHHRFAHGESLAKKKCECEYCGEVFEEYQSRIKNGKGRYCSKDCKHEDGRVEVSCSYCGDTVSKTKNRAGRYSNHYCSQECNRAYMRTGGEAAPGWDGGAVVTKECDVCEDDVTRTRSQFYDRVFCSIECMALGSQGENSPLWEGGSISWYGPNWDDQRTKALERDNHECQACGMGAGEHKTVFGRDLDVHHIRPLRVFKTGSEFDYESANALSNLSTLCRICHETWESIPVAPRVIQE